MITPDGLIEVPNEDYKDSWSNTDVGEKIKWLRDWINGPGSKLLDSQVSKPYNFEEAVQIRKNHEQFEFKCMKALEVFAELSDLRKQSNVNIQLSELDYMVQTFVEKLNKRTFFVVSCFTYFRIVEELWDILEHLQKKAKEVDTYDSVSIREAISELEQGVEKSDLRLSGLSHEIERLKIILTPIDVEYLNQLETGFRDACRAASEATQALKIRKLILKKQAKLLECEDNVYESIGWIEELFENIEIMYQDNGVGKNQLEAGDLLKKYTDIDTQAKTTYTYCTQLLETYSKLCEADGKRLPRTIGLSKSRLYRVWPRLIERLLELQERTASAEMLYNNTDLLLNRVQEYLLELSRSPSVFDKKCGSPTMHDNTAMLNDQRRSQLESVLQDFFSLKSAGLQLIERLPKGLLNDDPMYNLNIIDEVTRMIRLKLYTLWLKVREYEYAILGHNTNDNTTATELAPDWKSPRLLSRSSNSTIRRMGSLFDPVDEFSRYTFVSPQFSVNMKNRDSRFSSNQDIFDSFKRAAEESPKLSKSIFTAVPSSSFTHLPTSKNSINKINEAMIPQRTKRLTNTPPPNVFEDENKTNSSRIALINMRGSSSSTKEDEENMKELFELYNHQIDELFQINRRNLFGQNIEEIENEIIEHEQNKINTLRMLNQIEQHITNLQLNDVTTNNNTNANTTNNNNNNYYEIEEHKGLIESNMNVIKNSLLNKIKNKRNLWLHNWSDYYETVLICRLNFLKRLRDLKIDLGECSTRLNQLINATCLGTQKSSDQLVQLNNSEITTKLGFKILKNSDVHHINTINEEVKGMIQTIPAQEQFIHLLVQEIKNNVQNQFDNHIEEIYTIWNQYSENLKLFEDFMLTLTQGYNVISQLGTFSINYEIDLNDPNKQLNHLKSTLVEGNNLEHSIVQLMKPDRLTLKAREINKISTCRPKVGWITSYLKYQSRLLKSAIGELEMITRNLMASGPSPVSLGDLILKAQNGKYDQNHIRESKSPSGQNSPLSAILPASDLISSTNRTPTPPIMNEDSAPPLPPRSNSNSTADFLITTRSQKSALVGMKSTWQITKSLLDIECAVGDDVTFVCDFVGPLELKSLNVSWIFKPLRFTNGKLSFGPRERVKCVSNRIEDTISLTSAELKITQVNIHQAGQYTVHMKNLENNERIESTATLSIHPKIVQNLTDVNGLLLNSSTGLLDTVEMIVKYDGFHIIPTVNWMFEGRTIDSNIWFINTSIDESSISSSNVHIQDRGCYTCQIIDPLTNIILRSSCNLVIELQPSRSTGPPLLIGLNEIGGQTCIGGPVTLKCPLPKYYKPKSTISIEWLHDNQIIYTFKPYLDNQLIRKPIWNKLSNMRENQFQIRQTIWQTYLTNEYCVLSTNKVSSTDEGSYTCRIKLDNEIFESTGFLSFCENLHFVNCLNNLSVYEGETCQMECCVEFQSNEQLENNYLHQKLNQINPKIQWYLNDILLDFNQQREYKINTNYHNGLCTLNIDSLSKIHEGIYRCDITLGTKTIQTYGELNVKESKEPIILEEVRKYPEQIELNETLNLYVIYLAEPKPEIIWMKDNELIDTNLAHYKMELLNNRCTLTIFRIQPSDEGLYTVKLSNTAGSKSSSIRVCLENVDTSKGISDVELQTMVEQNIGAEIQINKNDLIIDEQLEKSMDLIDLKPIIFGPLDVKTVVGESVQLFCILCESSDLYIVHWTHNGQILKNNTFPSNSTTFQTKRIKILENEPKKGFYSLQLKRINLKDEGFYGVTVSKTMNVSGKIINQVLDESGCWVQIDHMVNQSYREPYSAPSILNGGLPSHMNAELGNSIELKCKVIGNPKLSYFWLKDHKKLINETNDEINLFQLGDNYKLILPCFVKNHAGDWDLVCYNSKGLAVTSCKLQIAYPETLDRTFKNISPDNKMVISVQPPAYSRSINKIKPAGVSSPEFHQKSGNSSNIGKCEPPEFQRVFTDLVAKSGETVCLPCTVVGNPIPSIQWTYNNKVIMLPNDRMRSIQSDGEYSLVIYEVRPEDSGRYAITADNIAGTATCSAMLMVKPHLITRFSKMLDLSRKVSSFSEPEYTNINSDLEYGYPHNSRQISSSGQQTPERKRSALIRSISAPTSYIELNPSNVDYNHCCICNGPIGNNRNIPEQYTKFSNYKFESSAYDEYRTYRQTKPSHFKSRRGPSALSRRMAGTIASSKKLHRPKSEGQLIHQCPFCDTLMLPVHIKKTKEIKYSKPEDLYYYQPKYKQIIISHQSNKQFKNIQNEKSIISNSNTITTTTNNNNNTNTNHYAYNKNNFKQKSIKKERQIPIIVENLNNSTSKYTNSKFIKSKPIPIINENNHHNHDTNTDEINYSVVESSDNESLN